MRGTELVRERERTVLYLVPSLLLKDGCVHPTVSLDGSLSEGRVLWQTRRGRLLLPTACNPCFRHPTPHPTRLSWSPVSAVRSRFVVEATRLDWALGKTTRWLGAILLFFLVCPVQMCELPPSHLVVFPSVPSPDVRASTAVRNAIAP